VTRAACLLALALASALAAPSRGAAEDAPPAGEAAVDLALRRQVEAALDRCIGPGLSWGHYEGQFKDLLALGPGVPRVLLRLFTTPHAAYTFAHDFADRAGEDAVDREQRTLILQRLAGDALGEAKDRDVVPALRTFAEDLEKANPDLLAAGPAQQDALETAAVALLKLGEPLHFERRVRSLRAAAQATVDASGELRVAPAPDREGRVRQWDLLCRLASLHMRDDNVGAAERAYRTLIDVAGAELHRLRKTPQAYADWARTLGALRSAHYNLACVFALRVKTAEALRSLKQAVDYGYLDIAWLKRDRDLDPIRDDPGYTELIEYLETRIRTLREAAKRELEKEREPGAAPQDGAPAPPKRD
jgi:hypothetical protein